MKIVSGCAAVLALALFAAPAAYAAEEGTTSGPAAGTSTEPSSKGGGSADKAMQEGPASAEKSKQQGASESSSGAK